jgi:hypothetical protein
MKLGAVRYLVSGSEGPGFASPEETLEVLENGILPTFDALLKIEAEKKIVAGGLPVADRAFVFSAEAASSEELDAMLRGIPAWGVLQWQVTPLVSFSARAEYERNVVKTLKGGLSPGGGRAPGDGYQGRDDGGDEDRKSHGC